MKNTVTISATLSAVPKRFATKVQIFIAVLAWNAAMVGNGLAQSISSPSTVSTAEDTPIPSVPIGVTGFTGPVTLSAFASPPIADFSVSGSAPTFSLRVLPRPNSNGIASVSLMAADGSSTATRTFQLSITAVNDRPTITIVPDLIVLGPGDFPVMVTGLSAGPANESGQSFTLAGASDAPGVAAVVITHTPSSPSGTATVTANGVGAARITLTVTDSGGTTGGGQNSASTPFYVFVRSNTAPSFTCGSNQIVGMGAGPQVVSGWATNILPHTPEGDFVFAANFSSQPAGTRLLDTNGTTRPNPRIEAGVLKLTDAGDPAGLGGFAIGPFEPQSSQSVRIEWKSRIGGGTGGGADGYSLNLGDDLSDTFTGEEGTGTGLIVTVDTFDNGGGDDVGTEIKWRGSRVASQAIPKDNDGSGNYLRKDQFVDASVSVSPGGVATFIYDGNTLTAPLPGFGGIRVNQISLGARTGAANDNHWIDDLIIRLGATEESHQTVQFIAFNNNPSLFSAQPAISPNGTLTYTPSPDACGIANVTVIAMDDGGTNFNGQNTSPPCEFTLQVVCGNRCPVASPSTVTVNAGSTASFQLQASDPDNDALQYSVSQSPAHGVIVLQPQTGAASYTPNPGYTGPDSFNFRVSDGACPSADATVRITVRSATDPPTAQIVAAPLVDFRPEVANPFLIVCTGEPCATLHLDGSSSSDPAFPLADLTFGWFFASSSTPFADDAQTSVCLEPGTWAIQLAVTNPALQSDSDTLTVDVVSPCDAIDALIQKIENSALIRRNKRPLIASLKAACASADRNNTASALNQLVSLQNKVRAQIARDNPVEAECFIQWAQMIIDQMEGCTNGQ